MEKLLTGELLAKLYLELDDQEKAFFFNKIGALLREKRSFYAAMPNQDLLAGDGKKAIKSFSDFYFSHRMDERCLEKEVRQKEKVINFAVQYRASEENFNQFLNG